ncbi:MAG: LysM peptidoglycan-binding domain-containing protein [Chloroflexota bacterium]
MHRRIILCCMFLLLTLACRWGSVSLVREQDNTPTVVVTSEGQGAIVQVSPPTSTPQKTQPNPVETLPTPTPQAAIPAMPLPTPPNQLVEFYTVKPGDTLGGISFAYDIGLEELTALNNLDPASAIIQVGQTINVPLRVSRTGPLVTLIPDSEVVYSPAYVDFDVDAFIQSQGGYLATYRERVNGVELDSAEIINRLARQFSVGPRVILALMEYYSGWVTEPNPTELNQAMGPANPFGENLFLQISWTANRLNEGYYRYKRSGSIAVRFRNGSRAIVPYGMNAGTVALQNTLAVHTNWQEWQTQVQPTGFMQTYRDLFGEPETYVVAPVVPLGLAQPPMRLPWRSGTSFYFTGGPHAAYGEGSAWAAIDFGPPDVLGSCFYSNEPLAAVADGRLFLGRRGEMYLDLDNDGNLQTGWVILYLHAVASDAVRSGEQVTAGTPLGFASCEGGRSTSSHLHLARRYNGEWIAADGPVPFTLSGWQVYSAVGEYNGEMIRDGVVKTACECWGDDNKLLAE